MRIPGAHPKMEISQLSQNHLILSKMIVKKEVVVLKSFAELRLSITRCERALFVSLSVCCLSCEKQWFLACSGRAILLRAGVAIFHP